MKTLSSPYLSENLADLAEIYRPEINCCVIKRRVSDDITLFVNQLLAKPRTLEITQTVSIASFEAHNLLPTALHFQGYTDFCNDIAHLIDIFSDLFGLNAVGLRLGLLDKAMCPRFHVDRVPCRLVCTYGGLGTEWLEDSFVERSKLGRGSNGLADEESGAILDLEQIETMPAYSIGLLKGTAWEGNELNGAVHRSPSLNAATPRRLFLSLDFG